MVRIDRKFTCGMTWNGKSYWLVDSPSTSFPWPINFHNDLKGLLIHQLDIRVDSIRKLNGVVDEAD